MDIKISSFLVLTNGAKVWGKLHNSSLSTMYNTDT